MIDLLEAAPLLTTILAQLRPEARDQAVTELVALCMRERVVAFEQAAEVSRAWTKLDDVRWELDTRAKAERSALKR